MIVRSIAAFVLALPLGVQQVPDAFPTPPRPAQPEPGQEAEATDGTAEEVEQIEPYEGTLSEGLVELRELAAEGELAASLELADRLLAPSSFLRWRQKTLRETESITSNVLRVVDPALEKLGLLGAPSSHRAEVHYARGVVLGRQVREEQNPDLLTDIEGAFQSARALAGSGDLRLDSIYNLGAGVLALAEAVRLTIPEVREKLELPPLPPQQPPTAPPGPGGPGAAEEPPDPIEIARAFYLDSREHFIEHLRVDWRDEDTRANVELIQRRLKELDEIEKQREEQQQEEQENQEQQENQDNPQEDQDQDGEQQENQEENQDQQENENQRSDEEPQEQEEQEQPEEQEGEEEQQEQPTEEPQPQPAEPSEEFLTREEVMRLLERLEDIEEEAEKIEAQLKDSRRVPVERDW